MKNTVISLGVAGVVALVCVVLVVRYRAFVRRSVVSFFTDAGPALDLAIFRIIFYATSFALLLTPLSQLLAFAALPDTLIFPPIGWEWLAHVLPKQPDVVRSVYALTIATGVTSAIGLYTRASSIVYAVGLTYVMTIPQLYGKVNHAHVVVWVAVLLAASRTADVWSVDALRKARSDARAGRTTEVADSSAYSRPLRITWLFLGLTYFFPGVWKFALEGLRWASPGNLRGILYSKWYELGGYQPPIPVDNSLLLVAVGMGTFFFEITFIFWLFDRRTRWISPLMGLAFHTGTNIVMRIGFYQSLGLYPAFVPWTRVLRWMRRKKETVTVTYDPRCPTCRSAVSRIAVSALPGAVAVQAHELARIPAGDSSPASEAPLAASHCAGLSYAASEGDVGARRVLRSSPLLAWRSMPGLGGAEQPFAPMSHPLPSTVSRLELVGAHSSRGPLVVASVIIPLEVLAGVTGTGRAWPIALYPTFAYDSRAWTTNTLQVEENGQQVDLAQCFDWMPAERLGGLLSSIAASPETQQSREVNGLLEAARRGPCALPSGSAQALVIDQVTVSVDPARLGNEISSKEILEVN